MDDGNNVEDSGDESVDENEYMAGSKALRITPRVLGLTLLFAAQRLLLF